MQNFRTVEEKTYVTWTESKIILTLVLPIYWHIDILQY